MHMGYPSAITAAAVVGPSQPCIHQAHDPRCFELVSHSCDPAACHMLRPMYAADMRETRRYFLLNIVCACFWQFDMVMSRPYAKLHEDLQCCGRVEQVSSMVRCMSAAQRFASSITYAPGACCTPPMNHEELRARCAAHLAHFT
eukprot:6101123-Amphidinium_carterae.1